MFSFPLYKGYICPFIITDVGITCFLDTFKSKSNPIFSPFFILTLIDLKDFKETSKVVSFTITLNSLSLYCPLLNFTLALTI